MIAKMEDNDAEVRGEMSDAGGKHDSDRQVRPLLCLTRKFASSGCSPALSFRDVIHNLTQNN
jgi:hypothetical protein